MAEWSAYADLTIRKLTLVQFVVLCVLEMRVSAVSSRDSFSGSCRLFQMPRRRCSALTRPKSSVASGWCTASSASFGTTCAVAPSAALVLFAALVVVQSVLRCTATAAAVSRRHGFGASCS